MNLQEKEMLEQWIIDINETKTALIVEGKKDVSALRNIGINNETFTISSPIYSLAEKIAKDHTSVIILTDLDGEGKKLYHKLKLNLERLGVKVDRKFREQLQGTKISHIEGIDTYYQNICK